MDNEVSIPYHGGLSVGVAVDFTERQLARGATSVVDGIAPTSSKIKSMSCKFCLADKFIHVCQVLDIPHEYALKVESGLVHNDVIKTCLHDIYNKRTFKVIFRLKYIWERQEHTTSLGLDPEWDPLSNSDTLDTGREGVLTSGEERPATHVVKALYTGDELVVVMTISATESDDLDSFYEIIEAGLGGLGGYIEADTMLKTIEKLGASLDKNLGQKRYKDVKCGIKYGTYADLDTYPTTVSGMARVVKEFTNKWMYAENAVLHPAISAMNVRTENDKGGQTEESTPVMQMSSNKTIDVFKLRVTLQPAVDNGRPMTEDYLHAFEAIFSCVYALNKTSWNIQDFLKNHKLFSNATYKSEGEEIDKLVRQKTDKMIEIIKGLVMGQPLSMEYQQKLKKMATKTRDEVDNFITKVTTKLPVGGDLNLLIIGKTGHGKSSTANTILRRKEFAASSGGISETKTCQQGWSKLDGRTFKVVDVPGVCDTNFDSAESAKLAVKCISEAISMCSRGFHALLLVLRYGNRMTEEEERAIYMLKCILGQTIVHCHCICVVTHGDNFEENDSFEDWCKQQHGSLKDVFEECNYRCVLFNNKTSDPAVLRTQLIELVSKVDSLKQTDRVYTNEIFKHAEKDRQRLSEKLNLPHFKEDFLRDLNLLQDDFEEIEKANASERQAKIEKLKSSTENLRRDLEKNQCGGLADLYQAVSSFSERLHRQNEKEFADSQLREERELFQEREKELKQEWETNENRMLEQTERRVIYAVKHKEAEVKAKFRNRSWWSKFKDLIGLHDLSEMDL